MKHTQRISFAITLSLILLALRFTTHYWPVVSDFTIPLGGLILLILGLTLVLKLISTSLTLYKKRKELSFILVLPTLIYSATIFVLYADPTFLKPETYESEILFRGCYEGTVNTGVIYFRESGKFEYRHGGAFGFTTYRDGTWKKNGDTLSISYTNNNVHEFVGAKLLMTDDRFIKIQADTLQDNRWGFYRGYCKGLN